MQLVAIGYGFGVRASADDVMSFASTWPGAGFPDKGFTAYFDAKPDPDLVDLSGWAADPDGDFDGYGLSALIDDMKEWGVTRIADAMAKSPGRRSKVEQEIIQDLVGAGKRQLRSNSAGPRRKNPPGLNHRQKKLLARLRRGQAAYRTRSEGVPRYVVELEKMGLVDVVYAASHRDPPPGQPIQYGYHIILTTAGRADNPAGRKIESKAQWRKLAAMMTRGELSKKDFDDMVAASKPFDRLPARKGRKSKRRKSTRRR